MSHRPLSLTERDQLVERLLACTAMIDEAQRAIIIGRLPPALIERLQLTGALKVIVSNIVAVCDDTPGAIEQLLDALRYLSDGT